jgi:sphingolipid delta-4 desaturase
VTTKYGPTDLASTRAVPYREGFIQGPAIDPHRERMCGLLAAHPDVRSLVGNAPSTALWIAAVMIMHVGMAAALSLAPWWAILLAAYTVGAVLSLGLWTLLHECSHDLVFRRSSANRWLGIVTGLPHVLPSATSFRKYHLMHHRHHGSAILDGDVPSASEARWVGRCSFRKALWLLSYSAVQSFRVQRMKGVKFQDRWFAINLIVQLAFNAALLAWAGWGALAYLALSNIFSLGLHPLGGRWIQEHYVVRAGQETYSYYGPMNALVFNAGYHNEHHDLMRVPWMRLPRVKEIAPEYYEPLYAHTSWTALLVRFLTDKELTPFSRAIRGDPSGEADPAQGSSCALGRAAGG